MPIRPENKSRYPKNWKDIRGQILERAQNKCEQCGIENYTFGIRNKNGTFSELDGMAIEAASLEGEKIIRVILTVAHLDHVPENNSFSNLKALCQQCHFRHDSEHHRINRKRNRYLDIETKGQETFLKEIKK